MYVHIDCNSYFASCEIATRPGLEGTPVVVANGNENGGTQNGGGDGGDEMDQN